jgi:hypothetical protein|tara:strand:+ start:426 stop:1022 length:597 start_codon:yes stop_codon:yes gene_type:complete
MMPADAYRCYLALKNHFTKDHYDYIKYRGKTRASNAAFYKRKDRFWFEKFARQKNDKEIEEFFVSNFIYSTDPSTVWIGEMIKEGEGRYQEWQKKVQSLTYVFKEETESVFENKKVDDMFDCSKGHPPILKIYLKGDISLESMVIYDRILGYGKDFDKRLKDPVWETVSRKIKKYSPFLNIDVSRYKKILKEVIIHGS